MSPGAPASIEFRADPMTSLSLPEPSQFPVGAFDNSRSLLA